MPSPLLKWIPLKHAAFALALVGSACGGDDDGDSATDAGLPDFSVPDLGAPVVIDDSDTSLPGRHTARSLCDGMAETYDSRAMTVLQDGDPGLCLPGTMTEEALEDVRRRVNWFRHFYADLPDVGASQPEWNAIAQSCALMMSAQGQLDHFPGPDWACYTEGGAKAAGQSNLALGSGTPATAIDQFMFDAGNDDTLGHRRWILSPGLEGLGYGYFNIDGIPGMCQVTFGDGGAPRGVPDPEPTPYPPPGAFPLDQIRGRSSQVAWSISWRGADYSEATLRITDADDPDRVIPFESGWQIAPLPNGYGENTAIFKPGLLGRDGEVWRLELSGVVINGEVQEPLTWETEFVVCD